MSLELLGTMAECVSRDDRCSAPLSRGPSCGDGFDSSRYGAGLGFRGIDGHGLDALTTKVTLEPRIAVWWLWPGGSIRPSGPSAGRSPRTNARR